jgi:hypothetical protein
VWEHREGAAAWKVRLILDANSAWADLYGALA